jgi:hypothetical protein
MKSVSLNFEILYGTWKFEIGHQQPKFCTGLYFGTGNRFVMVWNRVSLVWPKLVWPNARLAETHLAESHLAEKMAENFTKKRFNKA